jgi:TetR/AcrR family transcriptional regulator, transcriptional repressor for nem operon
MRKGEATRQRIIAQAAPILNQRGFAGFSMQDVMDATGLEKGGLYRHFSGKEELAAEAFRYTVSRAERARFDNLDRTRGALEKLRQFIDGFVNARPDVAGGCAIFNTAIEEDDGNPVLRGLALKALRDWKGRVRRIVKNGIRAGEIQESTDAGRVANVVIATLEGALAMSRLEGDKTALEDAQAMLGNFLDGIANDQARPAERGMVSVAGAEKPAQR